jgi:hypothetical protein
MAPQVQLDNWLKNIGTLEAACVFAEVINEQWEFLDSLAREGDERARELLEKGLSRLFVAECWPEDRPADYSVPTGTWG